MHHLAILKADWNLIPEILTGKKNIETRWYTQKRAPWGKIEIGDTVFFKDAGKPVTAQAIVSKVTQVENLGMQTRNELLSSIWKHDVVFPHLKTKLEDYAAGKKYGIIIELTDPRPIPPFQIDKTGYGLQAAWITVENIQQIIA